jgi:shikimate kinase
MFEKNITFIGMPGAGKSTVGVVVAKLLCMTFIDTDLLIQNKQKNVGNTLVWKELYKQYRKCLTSYWRENANN